MDAIVKRAEENREKWGKTTPYTEHSNQNDLISISNAAKELAKDNNVIAIIVFTQSGQTAKMISKARPFVPIFAFTPDIRTFQKMNLYWGVTPMFVPYADTLETMIKHVETAIAAGTKLEKGQQVVLISGFPVGAFQKPNLAMLYTLGDM